MRLRDAIKLHLLIVLYGIAKSLEVIFESPSSRRVLHALLPAGAAAAMVLGVFTMPCGHNTVRLPPKPAASQNNHRPFFSSLIPVRQVGDAFSYARHPGYQVPLTFDFGELPKGAITVAVLGLTGRVTTRGQLRGTEAIWVEGVLSGTPYPGFVDRRSIDEDVTAVNRTFFEKMDDCCRQRTGQAAFTLRELLEGSTRTIDEVLADGKLEIVIADDTEIQNARLTICYDDEGLTCRIAQPTVDGPRFETLTLNPQ